MSSGTKLFPISGWHTSVRFSTRSYDCTFAPVMTAFAPPYLYEKPLDTYWLYERSHTDGDDGVFPELTSVVTKPGRSAGHCASPFARHSDTCHRSGFATRRFPEYVPT